MSKGTQSLEDAARELVEDFRAGRAKVGDRRAVETGIFLRLAAGEEVVPVIAWRDAQGKQRSRRVSGGIKTLRAALADEHAKRARGEQVAADPRLTLDHAADRWFEDRVSRLRPTTQATYRAAVNHLRNEFGRQRLTRITPGDVARYVSRRESEGAKGWTVRGELSCLSGIFRYAARHLGHVGQSPTALLDRVERPSLADQREKRILSPDELARLLAAIPERSRLLYELAAQTGGRLGEILGLVWGEVDLDAGTVNFTHQLASPRDGARERKRVPLKTKRSRRVVEIEPGIVAKLRTAKVAAHHSGDLDYVFPGQKGSGRDHRAVAHTLERAAKRAGLAGVKDGDGWIVPPVIFHGLRHSHASALIAAGWDLEEVSARLGHADVAITAQAYVRAYDASRRSSDRRDRLAMIYGGDPAASEPADIVPLKIAEAS
jgi:integrase